MRMSNEQVIDVVKEYVDYKAYMQAILIDGEWGVGKTYFIKNELINCLKMFTYSKVIYISLYGLSNVQEIYNEICYSIMSNKLKPNVPIESNKKDRYLKISANLVTKLSSTAISKLGFDTEKMPTISDFFDINNFILILDDLERTNIDLNSALGFINTLVEHDNNKVILIANETEIDSDQKASYDKIKEKVISKTLKYSPDLDKVIGNIIKEYCTPDEQAYLLKHVELIKKMFYDYKHENLRTLVFIVMAYSKISKTIDQIKSKSKYLDYERYNILKYCIVASIYIKDSKRKQLNEWENEIEVSYIKLKDDPSSIVGYKFIDEYLLHGVYDKEKVIKILKDSIAYQEEKAEKRYSRVDDNNLSISNFHNYFELEDKEVELLLNQLYEELKTRKYNIVTFKDIIIWLINVQSIGFDININKYIKEMLDFISESEDFYERDLDFIINSNDKDFQEQFNKYSMPIRKRINATKLNKVSEEINECFKAYDWIKQLEKLIEKKAILEHGFFSVMELELLFVAIDKAKTQELYVLQTLIRSVYMNQHTKKYLKVDISTIKKIIINLEKYSTNSKTKGNALNHIRTLLVDIIEFLG